LEVDSEKKLYDLTKFIVLSSVLTSIYGLYQWLIVGIAVNPSLTDLTINQNLGARIFSSFGNPNVYGEFLVLSIPFFLPLIFKANNMMQKVILTISSLPVLLMLFKTGSRSAWIAFAVCIFIFVFLWNKKYIPALIILGLVAIPFLPSSIYNRLMTIFNPNDSSLQYRQMIMGPALVMLRDYWITGVGLGSKAVGLIYQRYKGFGLTTVAHTHNLYIQLWLEAGILAILSFIMFMFRLAKNSYLKVNKFSNSKQSLIISAALASTLGILVMGFADYVWFYNRIFLMFWINISIVLSALNLKQG
jgi:O-antigen ligase